MKLRQENIKLQMIVADKDKSSREELRKVKGQSLKLIEQREKEFESAIQAKEMEFQTKVQELKL